MNLLKRGSPNPRSSSQSTNSHGFTPGNQPSATGNHQTSSAQTNTSTTTSPAIAASLGTVSTPLLMGGEHSAFRSLVPPSTAALLAASAQLGLARSYAAAVAASSNRGASSTSTNQSPPVSPRPSESDEEINVHEDDSDLEITSNNPPRSHPHFPHSMAASPLQLTKHDRNWATENRELLYRGAYSIIGLARNQSITWTHSLENGFAMIPRKIPN